MNSYGPGISSPHNEDRVLHWGLRLTAAVAASILILLVAFLVTEALPALRHIGITRFVTDPSWHPLSDRYDMTPMIAASLTVTLGAMLLAAPLGVGSAIYIRYYAPLRVAGLYRRLIELLAGIPSVVYGFWGLVVLVPSIDHGLLAGILILALMVLPTVALISNASLARVPREYQTGAAALGIGRWGRIRNVILPAARGGLASAIILGTARAIGETMAVLMVCGNVVQMPAGLMEPIRTLTANIALEMAYAAGTHRSSLFVSGLLLMAMVALLLVVSRWTEQDHPHG